MPGIELFYRHIGPHATARQLCICGFRVDVQNADLLLFHIFDSFIQIICFRLKPLLSVQRQHPNMAVYAACQVVLTCSSVRD